MRTTYVTDGWYVASSVHRVDATYIPGTNDVHTPALHSTAITVANVPVLPSSATGGRAAHPHPGYIGSQIASAAVNAARWLTFMPIARELPQQSVWCVPTKQSVVAVQERSKVGKLATVPPHTTGVPASAQTSIPQLGGEHVTGPSYRHPGGGAAQSITQVASAGNPASVHTSVPQLGGEQVTGPS